MKRYLGDGCYVDYDGLALWLTTEDGISVQNRICLEPEVYHALVEYVAALRAPSNVGQAPPDAGAGDPQRASVPQ